MFYPSFYLLLSLQVYGLKIRYSSLHGQKLQLRVGLGEKGRQYFLTSNLVLSFSMYVCMYVCMSASTEYVSTFSKYLLQPLLHDGKIKAVYNMVCNVYD